MTGPADTPFADDRPLFLVGCVRSGTTLTRNLLRRVPNFICPEETHFFRWATPYRTPQTMAQLRNNPVLQRHRGMDGISEQAFGRLLATCRTQAELQRSYVTAYASVLGITGPYRWFDKTPQNVYGAPMIAQELPKARFLHIIRNPLNVVASLYLGHQVKVKDIHGACNFWLEAVSVMQVMKAAYPERILELRYEDLIEDVPGSMARVIRFAGLDAGKATYHSSDARPERNLWRTALPDRAVEIVQNRCACAARRYGYDLQGTLGHPAMA